MKCNNRHCKYFEPAKQANEIELMIFGPFLWERERMQIPILQTERKKEKKERLRMAERLTAKDWENPMSLMWIKLGLIPMQNEVYRISLSKALSKLAHYEDLEEQGRLITLPCAVGDTVYSFSFNIVYPFTVNGFEINKNGVEFKGSYCGEEKSLEYWSIRFPVSKIGKTVFLTPEEAEAKLKG